MEEIDLREIERIETKSIVKKPDWFYHGFYFESTAGIIENGILARKHLNFFCKSDNIGNNGTHYISVVKEINDANRGFSMYKHIKNHRPLVILKGIKAIKCRESSLYNKFINTPLPFRYSPWSEEYQVYSKIQPYKIIGIECMVYAWAEQGDIFRLRRVRQMLELMKQLDSQLPVYDFSREKDGLVNEVDKEAFLEVSKSLKENEQLSSLSIKL